MTQHIIIFVESMGLGLVWVFKLIGAVYNLRKDLAVRAPKLMSVVGRKGFERGGPRARDVSGGGTFALITHIHAPAPPAPAIANHVLSLLYIHSSTR